MAESTELNFSQGLKYYDEKLKKYIAFSIDNNRSIQRSDFTNKELGIGAMALGYDSKASGTTSVSLGASSHAIGDYSTTLGYETIAGIKGFQIIALDENALTYTLDSTEGLEIGDIYSVRLSTHGYNYGVITNILENTVTVDKFYYDALRETEDNWFMIMAKPTIGTHNIGKYAFAEGYNAQALNLGTHAEGCNTYAYGMYSHVEGQDTIAGYSSHAEGKGSSAMGTTSHAEGDGSESSSYASHAEGNHSIASGDAAHAEGDHSEARGKAAHAEGYKTIAASDYSHSEGFTTQAIGLFSHAEGVSSIAEGDYSHTEGVRTNSTATGAHAEGADSKANGYAAHAEGNTSEANGQSSHAEGDHTIAEGLNSHTEGQNTTAIGINSHAGGFGTCATAAEQTTIGRWNAVDETAIFIIGNGTNDTNRNNAFTISNTGVMTLNGETLTDKELQNIKGHEERLNLLEDQINENPSSLTIHDNSVEDVFIDKTANKNTNIVYVNGTAVSNGAMVATNYIKVKPNTTYTVSRNNGLYSSTGNLAFYDSDKIYISGQQSTYDNFTTPENCNYVRFCVYIGSYTMDEFTFKDMTIIEGNELKPIGESIIIEGTEKAKLYGKKWLLVGDSITEKNLRADYNYHDYIALETGIERYNIGVSGSGYMNRKAENKAFYQILNEDTIPADADIITIFGGVNDCILALNSSELGDTTDSTDETVCGCINLAIDNIQSKYPHANLGIISPLPCSWVISDTAVNEALKLQNPNDVNCNMSLLTEKLQEICQLRNIPFLDLFHSNTLQPWDDDFNAEYFSCSALRTGDGLHPNSKGHKLFYKKIQEFLEEIYFIANGTYSYDDLFGANIKNGSAYASGEYSQATGYYTIANGDYQTVIGKYNIANADNLFVIGNGTDTTNRSNAMTVSKSGQIILPSSGALTIGSYTITEAQLAQLLNLLNTINVSTSSTTF